MLNLNRIKCENFHQFSSIFISILSLLLLLFIETNAQNDLLQILSTNPNVSIFTNYINEVGLEEILTSSGCNGLYQCPTVIVPTNEAINSVAEQLSWSTKSLPVKLQIISGHIIQTNSRLSTTDWLKMGSEMNFIDFGFGTGRSYPVIVTEKRYGFQTTTDQTTTYYYVNNALVVLPNLIASNGMIQIVDKLLYSPHESTSFLQFLGNHHNLQISQSLWYLLFQQPDYRQYVAQIMQGKSLFSTIFIVNDAGWNSVPREQLEKLKQNQTLLTSVLSYHYCPNQLVFREWVNVKPTINIFTGFSVPDTKSAINLSPTQLYKTTDNKIFVASGNTVSQLDSQSYSIQNAVVHIIQSPLGFIYENRYDLLKRINLALLSTCQADTICNNLLSSAVDMTIFNPTPTAMQYLNNLPSKNKTIFLQYLFIPIRLMKNQLTSSRLIKINNLDDAIRFHIVHQTIYVEGRLPDQGYVGAMITAPDQVGTNAVVHTIDAIPALPYETVQQYVARKPEFSLYNSYGFVQNMTLGEPYTFLAPINKAINIMIADKQVGNNLLTNQQRRDFIFRRHAFPLQLLLENLKVQQLYDVPTANYAFTRETVRLFINVINDQFRMGKITYGGQEIYLSTRKGSYQFTNGLLYPIEKLIYTINDLTTSMCSVPAC